MIKSEKGDKTRQNGNMERENNRKKDKNKGWGDKLNAGLRCEVAEAGRGRFFEWNQ